MADGRRDDHKNKKIAFVFVDDDQAVFGTLSGNNREVLFKLPSHVPKKPSTDPHRTFTHHQHNMRYIFGCKIRLFARWFFIDAATTLPNVDGFIVTGPAHLIPGFLKSNFIDPCLTAILQEVDDPNPHRINNASDFSDDSPVYDDSLFDVVAATLPPPPPPLEHLKMLLSTRVRLHFFSLTPAVQHIICFLP